MPIETKTIFNAQYVSLKPALDQIGGRVEWDNEAKRATVHANGKTILVSLGDPNVEVNGAMVALGNPPLVEDGVLYVPQEFFGSVVGQSITLA